MQAKDYVLHIRIRVTIGTSDMSNVIQRPGNSYGALTKVGTALAKGATVVKVDARITDIVNDYLDHRRRDVSGLFRALAENEYALIRTVAHDLIGTGGSFGFEGLSLIGLSLEKAAIKQQPEKAALLIEGLAEYLAGVEVVYE